MKELVNIQNRDGELFADSRDVAKVLGVDHKSFREMLEGKSPDIGQPRFETALGKSLPQGGFGNGEKYLLLSERQALISITFVRNSEEAVKAKIALVDAFLAMHQRLQEQAEFYYLPPEHEVVRTSLAITFNLLRPALSGKVVLMRKAFTAAKLLTAALPDYVDEPLSKSATELLGLHGLKMSTIMFNRRLEELGILELKSRPSVRKGVWKKFWCLTDKGKAYGKNLISDRNPRETQPHYFEDRFEELANLVTK